MSKKSIFLFALITSLSGTAFATQEYIGTWCKRYDDFTAVLVIDANENVSSYSRGNQAGEIVSPSRGFVSLGASRFHLVLNGEDQGVVDYRVGRIGAKTLKLFYDDGTNMTYKACTL